MSDTPTEFIHIPGPNPILVPGKPGAWDDGVIECCDILKDHDTYYLYYHGTSSVTGYQVGVATAPAPLGPWTKFEGNPVLTLGPAGSWEDRHVACACLLKEGVGTYYLFYSAHSQREGAKWDIGLATAPSPLGPWTKHPGNPVLRDFGYVGGVTTERSALVPPGFGTYFLYTEHPIGSTGPDYGPLSVATAQSPTGPWTKRSQVLHPGTWGQWDDGGFSEAKVLRRGGLFHVFYGGAKLNPTRILSRESIGYAHSTDGLTFHKHPSNPVAPREANPDAAAFAEVHAYFEPPFIYAYHTLRYNSRDGAEELGVQVLATSRPFRLTMPLLRRDRLPAGETTSLADCRPLSLATATSCSLTVECTYPAAAGAGLAVHVRASTDGLRHDTKDRRHFRLPVAAGQSVRATFPLPADVMFAKVLVENLDGAHPVRDLRVHATLGG